MDDLKSTPSELKIKNKNFNSIKFTPTYKFSPSSEKAIRKAVIICENSTIPELTGFLY